MRQEKRYSPKSKCNPDNLIPELPEEQQALEDILGDTSVSSEATSRVTISPNSAVLETRYTRRFPRLNIVAIRRRRETADGIRYTTHELSDDDLDYLLSASLRLSEPQAVKIVIRMLAKQFLGIDLSI